VQTGQHGGSAVIYKLAAECHLLTVRRRRLLHILSLSGPVVASCKEALSGCCRPGVPLLLPCFSGPPPAHLRHAGRVSSTVVLHLTHVAGAGVGGAAQGLHCESRTGQHSQTHGGYRQTITQKRQSLELCMVTACAALLRCWFDTLCGTSSIRFTGASSTPWAGARD